MASSSARNARRPGKFPPPGGRRYFGYTYSKVRKFATTTFYANNNNPPIEK
ncbi:MAG: hypothetical protein A4E53_04385 [Pelotomaculum sp. PtaB.Bin104]|nr:MAG: hypothetical protein A4E53_04385 [Pelotomaculum sp. PtaB.Bin104]